MTRPGSLSRALPTCSMAWVSKVATGRVQASGCGAWEIQPSFGSGHEVMELTELTVFHVSIWWYVCAANTGS